MTTGVLAPAVRDAQELCRRVGDRIVDGRYWYLRVGVFAAAVSYVVQTPSYSTASNWRHIVIQARDPFRQLPAVPGSHFAKLTFRLVPPLLVRFTHITPVPYFVFQGTLGVVAFTLLSVVFVRAGLSRHTALLLTLGVATTYAGALFFVDTTPYFDAIAIAALCVALAVRDPVSMFLAMSVAVWTDERALPAVIVVAAFHGRMANRRNAFASTAFTLAAYAAVRFWLTVHFDLSTDRVEVGVRVIHDYLSTAPIGVVWAFEGLWAILGAAFLVAVLRRDKAAVIPFGAIAMSVVAALAVNDVTRSAIYLLPAIPYCVTLLRDEDEDTRNQLFAWAVGICIVLPTASLIVTNFGWFYPLPIQILPS